MPAAWGTTMTEKTVVQVKRILACIVVLMFLFMCFYGLFLKGDPRPTIHPPRVIRVDQ